MFHMHFPSYMVYLYSKCCAFITPRDSSTHPGEAPPAVSFKFPDALMFKMTYFLMFIVQLMILGWAHGELMRLAMDVTSIARIGSGRILEGVCTVMRLVTGMQCVRFPGTHFSLILPWWNPGVPMRLVMDATSISCSGDGRDL